MRAVGIPDAAAAELAVVEDAARRGAALVRQLLAFARQQQLQPRVLALNDAVLAIAPLLRRLLGQAVRLDLALETPGRWVKADPTQARPGDPEPGGECPGRHAGGWQAAHCYRPPGGAAAGGRGHPPWPLGGTGD
ncbi:hypothetical protein [Dankookia sp. P2]|uniref:hypothetical protein n=1 Tax=Dankookia sp. P2 TaxID=3423955 RepID=UPI003D677AA4